MLLQYLQQGSHAGYNDNKIKQQSIILMNQEENKPTNIAGETAYDNASMLATGQGCPCN